MKLLLRGSMKLKYLRKVCWIGFKIRCQPWRLPTLLQTGMMDEPFVNWLEHLLQVCTLFPSQFLKFVVFLWIEPLKQKPVLFCLFEFAWFRHKTSIKILSYFAEYLLFTEDLPTRSPLWPWYDILPNWVITNFEVRRGHTQATVTLEISPF